MFSFFLNWELLVSSINIQWEVVMNLTSFQKLIQRKNVKGYIDSLVNEVISTQQTISKVRKPQHKMIVSYKQLLNKIGQYKGQELYFPYLSSGLGNGALIELSDGSIKYDFINGIGAHFCHSHPELIRAAIKGALCDTIMQGNLQQHDGSVELYEQFCKISGFDHVFLSSSGVMAWENAFKVAFHYKKTATRVLAFNKCFSGRTLAASQITDNSNNRMGLPHTLNVDYIPFYDASQHKKSIDRSVELLRCYLQRYPDQYACMNFELVQGEGGFTVGHRDFFTALMRILQSHDIPIYVDEIQTFGRTTELFAFQFFNLEQFVDIVSVGKLSQVCATLYNKKFNPKPGLLSQTFTSSTVAIESAKVILDILSKSTLYGNSGLNQKLFSCFSKHCQRLEKKYPVNFKGPFGIGAMQAFEVFGGDEQKSKKFIQSLYEEGVISFIAGRNPTRVRFLLPIGAISSVEIDEVMGIVEIVLLRQIEGAND